MIEKQKIHKDSEIWRYANEIEFTNELVDFFEEERKRIKREKQSDFRHIAFESLDNHTTYNYIKNKRYSVEEQVMLNQIYSELNNVSEVERRRYVLHKIYGLKKVEIAEKEGVSESAIRKSIKCTEQKLRKITDL